jgi:hypothetical protein
VTNNGTASGSYQVDLKIDGVKVDSKTIQLDAGGNAQVAFSSTQNEVGSHAVDVNGQKTAFSVVAKAPLAPPPHKNNIGVYVLVFVAVFVAAAVVTTLLVWRRA